MSIIINIIIIIAIIIIIIILTARAGISELSVNNYYARYKWPKCRSYRLYCNLGGCIKQKQQLGQHQLISILTPGLAEGQDSASGSLGKENKSLTRGQTYKTHSGSLNRNKSRIGETAWWTRCQKSWFASPQTTRRVVWQWSRTTRLNLYSLYLGGGRRVGLGCYFICIALSVQQAESGQTTVWQHQTQVQHFIPTKVQHINNELVWKRQLNFIRTLLQLLKTVTSSTFPRDVD